MYWYYCCVLDLNKFLDQRFDFIVVGARKQFNLFTVLEEDERRHAGDFVVAGQILTFVNVHL